MNFKSVYIRTIERLRDQVGAESNTNARRLRNRYRVLLPDGNVRWIGGRALSA